jgi:putative ABC transport system permease protein
LLAPAEWGRRTTGSGRPKRQLLLWAAFCIAVESLLRTASRSFLAMLGIIIGVASVITMLGLGEGTRAEMEERIRRMGTNVLSVRTEEQRQRGVGLGADASENMTLEDAEAILRECPDVIRTAPRVGQSAQVKYRNKNERVEIMGITNDYFTIRDYRIARGRPFGAPETNQAARVCLLGSRVVETMFGQSDPLNKRVLVRGQAFRVIGTVAPKGGGDSDWDERVWVPVTTAMRRLFALKYVSRIEAQARDEGHMSRAQEQIERLLRRRHRQPEDGKSGFEVRNQQDILDAANEQSGFLTMLLAGIAGVSLFVGGIGIMNIMLVSVVERTREIGIRRALGARRIDVLAQFLIEAVVMCGAGALLGVGFGLGCCWLGASVAQWPIRITAISIGLSCFSAVATGLFSGIYPATRASALSPIDALRYD